jgi:hypothetical protein
MGFFNSLKLTVEEGRTIQQRQVDHYCLILETDAQRQDFLSRVRELNAAVVNPTNGYDIPRGTDIEQAYFLAKGETVQDHFNYMASLD